MASIERSESRLPPQERVRRQVASALIPKIAELLYWCDKGSIHVKLADLTEEARAAYLADALRVTAIEARLARVNAVHRANAHQYALQDAEQEVIRLQVRRDVARFGVRKPWSCHVCRQPVLTDRVIVYLSESLHTEAHGLCCAKDEARYELIADFAYRVKAGQR